MLRLGLLTALTVAFLDQLTKALIVYDVMDPPRVIEVLPVFNIVMVWNRGASFGLFSADSGWTQVMLGGVAVVITVVLGIWLSRVKAGWLAVSIGCVMGGAVGNVIDRAVHGAVADFLDFHAWGYHWPAFNLADSAITVGVAMLLFDGLIGSRAANRIADRSDRGVGE